MPIKDFARFKQTIEEKFMGHPVVTKNTYTQWFASGDIPLNHLRKFAVQFSVFSNQFLLAALNRVIHADTLQAARESKEILMNELGVIYNNPTAGGERTGHVLDEEERGPLGDLEPSGPGRADGLWGRRPSAVCGPCSHGCRTRRPAVLCRRRGMRPATHACPSRCWLPSLPV